MDGPNLHRARSHTRFFHPFLLLSLPRPAAPTASARPPLTSPRAFGGATSTTSSSSRAFVPTSSSSRALVRTSSSSRALVPTSSSSRALVRTSSSTRNLDRGGGVKLRLFLAIGSFNVMVIFNGNRLRKLEDLYMTTFNLEPYKKYLKQRSRLGRRLRPAMFARLVRHPRVGPYGHAAGTAGTTGTTWRVLSKVHELEDGDVVTPMHLSWRAIARAEVRATRDRMRVQKPVIMTQSVDEVGS